MSRRFDAPDPWQCQNLGCQTVWTNRPDTWTCAYPECGREVCEDCKKKCSVCGEVFCKEHLMMLKAPNEPLCPECFMRDFPSLAIEITQAEIAELVK